MLTDLETPCAFPDYVFAPTPKSSLEPSEDCFVLKHSDSRTSTRFKTTCKHSTSSNSWRRAICPVERSVETDNSHARFIQKQNQLLSCFSSKKARRTRKGYFFRSKKLIRRNCRARCVIICDGFYDTDFYSAYLHPSSHFDTTWHRVATRQSALGIGVGSKR